MTKTTGIELYFKRIFGLMAGAVGVTALTVCLFLMSGMYGFLFSNGGMSVLYYVITFGALGFVIWAQTRIFSMKTSTGALLLFIYSVLMGICISPLILSASGFSILLSLFLAIIMFLCMSLFGYKTVKDLSGLGTFLFIGMIGLILVGILSIFISFGSLFSSIICLIGILVFAGFAAYDMQMLKRIYSVIDDETHGKKLAVLGALHMYISFVALFEYILGLTNRN
ncbi:MAG: Bax inhibitor-1/YccA family protein [Alphaproteobacteria bacterium]|nr:Bax inhibitor-1/YccA family protein [Alphaproteobacteria bacterium]